MLKKENRLTTKEFEEVFKKGKKIHTDTFIFIIEKNTKNGKIGISTPKKIYKNAVGRNNIKRKIYNFIQTENLLPTDTHILIILKNKLPEKTFQKELSELFKKNN